VQAVVTEPGRQLALALLVSAPGLASHVLILKKAFLFMKTRSMNSQSLRSLRSCSASPCKSSQPYSDTVQCPACWAWSRDGQRQTYLASSTVWPLLSSGEP